MKDPPIQSVEEHPTIISSESASGGDSENTLIPMLVWGLIFVTAGMIVLKFYV